MHQSLVLPDLILPVITELQINLSWNELERGVNNMLIKFIDVMLNREETRKTERPTTWDRGINWQHRPKVTEQESLWENTVKDKH